MARETTAPFGQRILVTISELILFGAKKWDLRTIVAVR